MKKKDQFFVKEFIMKCLILLSGVGVFGGILAGAGIGFGTGNYTVALIIIGTGIAVGIACIAGVFIIGNTLKEGDLNPNKYKIKTYDCALNFGIEERMQEKYGEVRHSVSNPSNFFSAYHKLNEVVIIAVMYVGADFCEDEFVQYMGGIPEVNEHIRCHTLIVIFLEKKPSAYLKEIMYTAEYNTLWDTKIFCIYDEDEKKLKVNKTDSGTGDKAYNDAKKELNCIFEIVKH